MMFDTPSPQKEIQYLWVWAQILHSTKTEILILRCELCWIWRKHSKFWLPGLLSCADASRLQFPRLEASAVLPGKGSQWACRRLWKRGKCFCSCSASCKVAHVAPVALVFSSFTHSQLPLKPLAPNLSSLSPNPYSW